MEQPYERDLCVENIGHIVLDLRFKRKCKNKAKNWIERRKMVVLDSRHRRSDGVGL